jgi:hypothetical protein
MRRAAKVDANQSDIVDALRSVGAKVQPLHQVGGGVPDLLVGINGRLMLIEVKDGSRPPSDRKLTPDQVKWHAEWTGHPVYVITDVTQAQAVARGFKFDALREADAT